MTRDEAISYANKFNDQLSDSFLAEVETNKFLQEQLEAALTRIYDLRAKLEDTEVMGIRAPR